jgi:vancomycin resistance protein YoaR
MRRLRTILLIVLAALGSVLVLVTVAWAVDARAHRGEVARNVSLAGTPVGGMTRAQLAGVVSRVADRYQQAQVTVTAPGGGLTTDAPSLGLVVHPARTADDAMHVGRTGGVLKEAVGWVHGLVWHRVAPVRVTVDRAAVYHAVPRLDTGPQTAPTEPDIKLEGNSLVAVDGKPGKGIDPAEVARRLPDAAEPGLPVVVHVHRGTVPPRYRVADAEQLADAAASLTSSALPVKAGSQSANVPVRTLRSWLHAKAGDAGLELYMDPAASSKDLGTLMPKAGTLPTETKFTVVNDVPQIIAGTPGTGCCSTGAADLVLQALRAGSGSRHGPVVLPLTRVDPTLTVDKAQSLGIKERVSTFTTPHACCQPRVHNIHLIADAVRGAVIQPGQTFSLNGFVGQRTTSKGYVTAPVIYEGKEDEDVGGGVSQFATTTFNAAFFAGLDFVEYQSHSLWISRYPYGREATVSWPSPDLKIKNTTPYGILIWPTYTETSLTVAFYSTHFVDAAQTGQTKAPKGPCTRVSTERTRTYLDGTVKVDHVFALYQPAEGVKCT